MELSREKWNKTSIAEFNKYLDSIKRPDKIDFTKRTVNTNMKVLGINIPTCKDIASKIHKRKFYGVSKIQ
jgi:hypothetical protein